MTNNIETILEKAKRLNEIANDAFEEYSSISEGREEHAAIAAIYNTLRAIYHQNKAIIHYLTNKK